MSTREVAAARRFAIREMWWEGKTDREIAEELGVTRGSVCASIYRMRRDGHFLQWRKMCDGIGRGHTDVWEHAHDH